MKIAVENLTFTSLMNQLGAHELADEKELSLKQSSSGKTLYSKGGCTDLFTRKSERMERQRSAREWVTQSIAREFGPYAGDIQSKVPEFFASKGKLTVGDLARLNETASLIRSGINSYQSLSKKMLMSDNYHLYNQGRVQTLAIVPSIPGFKPDASLSVLVGLYVKLAAKSKPLNAEVIQQMGALDAFIQRQSSMKEAIASLNVGPKVLDLAMQHDADGVKILPQMLVLYALKPGEKGHCNPLVLLAALAESEQPGGMNRFMSRLEQEVQEKQNSSGSSPSAYLQHLIYLHRFTTEELRRDVKKPTTADDVWGHRDAIAHMTADLKSGDKSAVFYGISTATHIMLIGATNHEGKEQFIFYDPNSGVARFPSKDKLSDFIGGYFGQLGYGKAYGIKEGSGGHELNLSKINPEAIKQFQIGAFRGNQNPVSPLSMVSPVQDTDRLAI
ncbi:MAG: YopT-type cysteine protease domain-containing protein [Alphaproteobacteria bacterium]|nr:YopT-type cysteine protease domain-containing protein [Alphaproteobacteria bacterium]